MATKTVTETIDHLEESMEKEYPCDLQNCLSGHKLPASWFFTHSGAESSCAWMMCRVCVRATNRVIDRCITEHKGVVHCRTCKKNIPAARIVLRPI